MAAGRTSDGDSRCGVPYDRSACCEWATAVCDQTAWAPMSLRQYPGNVPFYPPTFHPTVLKQKCSPSLSAPRGRGEEYK